LSLQLPCKLTGTFCTASTNRYIAMIEKIDHVNLVVQDLETMTEFYRDVLGFQVTKSVTISGPWIDTVVELNEVQADVVYLDLPAGPRVELIHYVRPASSQAQEPSLANAYGLRHLAFRVSNIEQTLAKLERAGVRPNSSIVTVPRTQVQYSDGARKRLVYFYDPEGNLLELCEYTSGK
jgi:catechol 2,3-dioxygenase-like lactoylglutathione lyase family enzyme